LILLAGASARKGRSDGRRDPRQQRRHSRRWRHCDVDQGPEEVNGTSTTLKRGTTVKGIRLTGNPDEVDCKAGGNKGLVLRTEFLKKA
jgi:hypothetical protein